MFLNPLDNKLYPDKTDKKLWGGDYEVPEKFKNYELQTRENIGSYLTIKQLDVINRKPLEGYLGFEWEVWGKKHNFYSVKCTVDKEDINQ